MIALALRYSFDIMKAKRVTIGVFAENKAALNCYLSAGFKDPEISLREGWAEVKFTL